jgi:hypothetical protein
MGYVHYQLDCESELLNMPSAVLRLVGEELAALVRFFISVLTGFSLDN